MSGFGGIRKALIIFGISVAFLGIIFILAAKIPGVGKLPGDIYLKKVHSISTFL